VKEQEKTFVSDSLDITQIAGKGRGYIANRDIKVGTLLLREFALRSLPFDFHGRTDGGIPEKINDSLIKTLSLEQLRDPRLMHLHYFKEELEEEDEDEDKDKDKDKAKDKKKERQD